MKQFFDSGNAFFAVAVLSIVVSLISENPAVYISVGIVFFILGLAVRKKNAEKTPEQMPKD